MSEMSENSSSTPNVLDCSTSEVNVFISSTSNGVRICMILPLCTLILYLGHQRWQQHSIQADSHSDFFAYNLAAMELIWAFGCFFYTAGLFMSHLKIVAAARLVCTISYYGEICFHVLTCVERYLAVIHPITYRNLKNARGVKMRNILILFIWLLCVVLASTPKLGNVLLATNITLIFLALCIVAVTVCSLSVLWVLIHPGPGEGGKHRPADPSKQRAFITIMTISCVVWLWFTVLLVLMVLDQSSLITYDLVCVIIACLAWFNLPTCLVSPLLYLHRAGKLPHCRGK